MGEQASGHAAGWRTALAVAVLGYALLAGTTESFTWPSLVVTVVPALLVVLLAIRAFARRGSGDVDVPRHGVTAWAVLAAATVLWQLAAYFQSPRADHPTISSMLDAADTSTLLRAAVFLGWIVLGVELARR